MKTLVLLLTMAILSGSVIYSMEQKIRVLQRSVDELQAYAAAEVAQKNKDLQDAKWAAENFRRQQENAPRLSTSSQPVAFK